MSVGCPDTSFFVVDSYSNPLSKSNLIINRGNLVTWNFKVGDEFVEGDAVAEIETDKAMVGFDVQDAGFLARILVEEGSSDVEVGTPIAVVAENQQDVAKFADVDPAEFGVSASNASPSTPPISTPPPPASDSPTLASSTLTPPPPSPSTPTQNTSSSTRIFASPLAKTLAYQLGVDLSLVPQGSGPLGRILGHDVESYIPIEEATSSSFFSSSLAQEETELGRTMAENKRATPHYYLQMEVGLDAVMEMREAFPVEVGVNDFILKASALCMQQVPEANSAWGGSFVREYENVNIDVVLATPGGHVVHRPIMQCQSKGLGAIAQDAKALMEGECLKNVLIYPYMYPQYGYTFNTLLTLNVYVYHGYILIISLTICISWIHSYHFFNYMYFMDTFLSFLYLYIYHGYILIISLTFISIQIIN